MGLTATEAATLAVLEGVSLKSGPRLFTFRLRYPFAGVSEKHTSHTGHTAQHKRTAAKGCELSVHARSSVLALRSTRTSEIFERLT